MKATVSLRMAMPSCQKLRELVLVDMGAVVSGAEVGLSFVEAADGVAEEGDELLLSAAAEAFRHVGHCGFGGVVDLYDEALVAGEG